MTRINKTQFPIKLRIEAWERIKNEVHATGSLEQFKQSLGTYISPAEMKMLEKRSAILLLLEKGKTYRNIGETIDVSRATVSYIKRKFTRCLQRHRRYSRPHYRPSRGYIHPGSLKAMRESSRIAADRSERLRQKSYLE